MTIPMKSRILRLALLALTGLTVLTAAPGCREKAAETKSAERYICPMHPAIVSDHPGDCPICGMRLQLAGSTSTAAAKPLFYRNPMDPTITSPVPAKDSMGMDYVPVYATPSGTNTAATPSGFSEITIDPARSQQIGLTTVAVERRSIGASIRTTGRVAWDETRTHHIHAKYDAYVELLHADYVGRPVKAGEPLVELYSPELLAAQEEFLVALRSEKSMAEAGALPNVASSAADLVSAARNRLRLLDVSTAEIDSIARAGHSRRTVTLAAPMNGFIVGKSAVHGMKVGPGDSLFDIADLSRVWVLADVYEAELPRIREGQRATMTLAYWPARKWSGKVAYVYPMVDEKTRTVKVRLEVPNPHGELKPDMFADVVLEVAQRTALVVPDDAVIDSGTRKVVFVSKDAGKLEPREVTLGEHGDKIVEVLAGLREGERVARGASFLVDSESRLESAIRAWQPSAPAASSAPPASGGGAP